MTVYSIPALILASIGSTVSLYELLSWSRSGRNNRDLAFALSGLCVTAFCVSCYGQYNVDSPLQSLPWLKAQTATLDCAGFAFLWYIAETTGFIKRRYLFAVLAWVALGAGSQLLSLGELGWIADRPIVQRVQLPFGLEFVYKGLENGPVISLQYAGGVVILAYIAWAILKYRRSCDRREARIFLAVLVIFCAALINDFSILLGLYSFIYLMEYAWLAMLLLVGLRRSSEARDAFLTKKALEESERELRESRATLSAIVDSTPDLIWSVDAERFGLLSFNAGLRDHCLKTRRVELEPGRTPEEGAASEEELRTLRGLYARALKEGSYSTELELLYEGYSEPSIMQLSFSVLRREGKVFGVSVFGKDITERKRAEELIAKSLREKETLLRELYHRTKNNMNVIISMLRLQAAYVGDERLRSAFAETEDRILSMSLVHEKLYESSDLSHINLRSYIEDLATRLFRNYGLAGERVALAFGLRDVQVPIDTAVSCGLIINELISNSLKYAFPGDRRGAIRIELGRGEGAEVRLAFSDDGIGLPPGFDVQRDGHLGMQLILSLAKGRLDAAVSILSERGFSCELEFESGFEGPSD